MTEQNIFEIIAICGTLAGFAVGFVLGFISGRRKG